MHNNIFKIAFALMDLRNEKKLLLSFVKMIILSDDNIKLNLPYLISIDVKECLIIFKCPEWRLLSLSC